MFISRYDINFVWRDSYCKPKQGIKMAVDIWESVGHLDGIIGAACSVVSCKHIESVI